MSALLTIEAFRATVPSAGSLGIEIMEPAIKSAEWKHIKPLLGKVFFDKCVTEAGKANNEQDDDFKIMFPILQEAISYHAIQIALPNLLGTFTGSGLVKMVTENKKGLFQWEKLDIEDCLRELACQAIEKLLLQLVELKVAEFLAEYILTEEFDDIHGSLVNFTSEFQRYYEIGKSCRTFSALKPIIREVEEFFIKPAISRELFEEMLDELQLDGELSNTNKTLMQWLGPGLANYTIAHSVGKLPVRVTDMGFMVTSYSSSGSDLARNLKPTDERGLERLRVACMASGDSYMQNLKYFLNQNKDSYPLYRDSTSYTGATEEEDINTSEAPSVYL